MSNEPKYTKGERKAERIQYSQDGQADTLIYVRDHRGRHGTVCVGGGVVDLKDGLYSDECEANARLSAASDNAVLVLAEHLNMNAVLLAERLEGGALVRLVEALEAMLRHFDNPSRSEWPTDEAWKEACSACKEARAALEAANG